MEDKPKMKNLLKEIISVFLQEYLPAENIADSDEFISTQEIAEKIEYFITSQTSEEKYDYHKLIIEEMKKAGFKYKLVVNQFKWMMKEKNS